MAAENSAVGLPIVPPVERRFGDRFGIGCFAFAVARCSDPFAVSPLPMRKSVVAIAGSAVAIVGSVAGSVVAVAGSVAAIAGSAAETKPVDGDSTQSVDYFPTSVGPRPAGRDSVPLPTTRKYEA